MMATKSICQMKLCTVATQEAKTKMSAKNTDSEQWLSTKLRPQVIVDVDAGADDAMALLLLIAAQRCKDIDVLAITCVHGNSTINNVCTNVLRTLETTSCFDIPVFRGADKPLIPLDVPLTLASQLFFGSDGFGDINLPNTPDLGLVQSENAIQALNRLTASSNSKGKVSLVCLGPLTNIALAMRTYPEFAENLQEIYIMGGNFTGVGNVTSAAEFNFYHDPEAAHIVLTSAVCPITMLPWETILKTEIPLDWRFNVLGGISNKQMDLLNAVEKKVYGGSTFSVWYPCDAIVAAILIRPNIIVKSHSCHVSVELHGRCTRGQVVVDHLRTNNNNVHIIEEVNCSSLKNLLLWAVGHPNSTITEK